MTAPPGPVPGILQCDRLYPENRPVPDPNSRRTDGTSATDPIPWTPDAAAAARRETVDRLKREITAGTYRIPSGAVADAIIRFFDRRSDT